MVLLPVCFWEELVEILNSMGYKVLTNSKGKEESPIKGTILTNIPISCLVPFVDKAGIVIGVRSSFMDVIESSKAKKIVIYTKVKGGFGGAGKHSDDMFASFSINKWFEKDIAEEFIYNGNKNELLDGVISAVCEGGK